MADEEEVAGKCAGLDDHAHAHDSADVVEVSESNTRGRRKDARSGGVRSRVGLSRHGEKAGLEKVDKDRVNQIVYEHSKNSSFFKNQQERAYVVEEKIEAMLKAINGWMPTPGDIAKVDAIVLELEQDRELDRVYFHVDMDAFFASCEERDDPSLKSVPMAVGGNHMLTTSNYVARQYGVRSAMPGFIAKSLCPQLVIVKPDYTKYTEASDQVQEVLMGFDEGLKRMSLDEASLDVTEHLKASMQGGDEDDVVEVDAWSCSELMLTRAEELSVQIRKEVTEKTKLTCSVGIAPSRLLAKVCADLNKPNGQYCIRPFTRESVIAFVRDLAPRKISGIGKVTERMLEALGVQKVGDLWEKRYILWRAFSEKSCRFFYRTALGCFSSAPSASGSTYTRKSISTERTFRNISEEDGLVSKLSTITKMLVKDMAVRNIRVRPSERISSGRQFQWLTLIKARRFTLKIKTSDFRTRQRSHTSDYEKIFEAMCKILLEETPLTARLMGVKASELRFGGAEKKRSLLETMFARCQEKEQTGKAVPTKGTLKVEPAQDSGSTSELAASSFEDAVCNVDCLLSEECEPERLDMEKLKQEDAGPWEGENHSGDFYVDLDELDDDGDDECEGNSAEEDVVEILSPRSTPPSSAQATSNGIMILESRSSPGSRSQEMTKAKSVEDQQVTTCPVCDKSLRDMISLLHRQAHVSRCLSVGKPMSRKRRLRSPPMPARKRIKQEEAQPSILEFFDSQ